MVNRKGWHDCLISENADEGIESVDPQNITIFLGKKKNEKIEEMGKDKKTRVKILH